MTLRPTWFLAGLALGFALLEFLPGVLGPYGYFIDELYYVACANHLAFGYVDHPPLSILLLWLVRLVAGESIAALRILPALAGGATVLVTGIIARRLGAGLFGQALAAGAAMGGSLYHVLFSFYSMNALSVLIWSLCFLVLVEIERRGEPRLWIVLGVLAGLAMQNKHTFVLLLLSLGIGLVLTPARRHLAARWLWLGACVAALLFVPNLLWQLANSWPSLEFYRNADLYKNVPTPPLEVLKQQILFMNPASLPIWVAGLLFLLRSNGGRAYRHLGWIYIVLLGLMLVGQKSRPDRIADAYTILFAGGAVLIERLTRRPRLGWIRWLLALALLAFTLLMAPLGMPLLSPGTTARYATTLGIVPQIESGEGKRTQLPQWLADRFGWEELAADVADAADRLSPAERDRAIVLAPSYGQAGAIELFGKGRNLPPVYSGQNSYHQWGPPVDPVDAAIVIGPMGEETVRRLFEEVELFGVHDCEWCMPWRDEVPIWIGRGPRVSFAEVWPLFRHYE